MINPASHPPLIFVSYSHNDKKWLKRLQVHLRPLAQKGAVDAWDDTRIKAGDKWRDEIRKAIASAKVAILLISAGFLASEFITQNELPPLLEAEKSRGLVILPVIISPCRFTQTESLSVFQAINASLIPLNRMAKWKQEDLLVELSVIIESVLMASSEAPSSKNLKSKSTLRLKPTAIPKNKPSIKKRPRSKESKQESTSKPNIWKPSTIIPSGRPYFRITSLSFHTANPADYVRVVNGQGAIYSPTGARYNYPGLLTVYLAEDLETCFAEKLFYNHREVLRAIDIAHLTGVIPAFQQRFVLWEITLQNDVNNVFDMSSPSASSLFGDFPSLTVNPSQDYEYLKKIRSEIQSSGYKGMKCGVNPIGWTVTGLKLECPWGR